MSTNAQYTLQISITKISYTIESCFTLKKLKFWKRKSERFSDSNTADNYGCIQFCPTDRKDDIKRQNYFKLKRHCILL